MSNDVIEIAQNLIRCPSVTPADEGAQDYLAGILTGLGFECHHLPFGEGSARVPNLFARIGTQGPHLCYAGHTDVVPPGPEEEWTFGPFNPEIKDGVLYGRGASDMKGSVAAFAAGAASYLKKNGPPKGSISLLITGDEEALAEQGTVKVLEWMKDHDQIPDVALVGEPTNSEHLSQEIKIGRRGSYRAVIEVTGKQGHIAYPHLADNPVPGMIKLLDALASYEFDRGSEYFSPTNLEVTSIDVGNEVENVIPGKIRGRFGIRFNELWTYKTLDKKVREILDSVCPDYTLTVRCNAESFLTRPCAWTNLVRRAVEEITGKAPDFTTTGGTSDARFIVKYCPVVEFGPINATIHKIDENAKINDLESLSKIYERLLELYFA